MVTCIVPNCRSRSMAGSMMTPVGERKISFHQPVNEAQRQVWATVLQCCRTEFPKKIVVCSLHFEQNCFEGFPYYHESDHYRQRRRILENSVPTLNLMLTTDSQPLTMPLDTTTTPAKSLTNGIAGLTSVDTHPLMQMLAAKMGKRKSLADMIRAAPDFRDRDAVKQAKLNDTAQLQEWMKRPDLVPLVKQLIDAASKPAVPSPPEEGRTASFTSAAQSSMQDMLGAVIAQNTARPSASSTTLEGEDRETPRDATIGDILDNKQLTATAPAQVVCHLNCGTKPLIVPDVPCALCRTLKHTECMAGSKLCMACRILQQSSDFDGLKRQFDEISFTKPL